MKQKHGIRKHLAALVLAMAVSLVPAAAAGYQSSWLAYGGHEFEVRLVFSAAMDQTGDYTLQSYGPGGQLLSEPLAHIYALEGGSIAEQIMGFENGVRYDGVSVTGCAVSRSGGDIQIRDSGETMPLRAGDTMSRSGFGGYDAIRYYRVDHLTNGQEYEVIYYFLLEDGEGDPQAPAVPEGDAGEQAGGSQACDHDRQPSWWKTVTEAATCVSEGRSYRVCERCGQEETLAVLSRTDHNWEKRTEAGQVFQVCAVCGKKEILSAAPQAGASGSHDSGGTDMPKLSQQEIVRLLESASGSSPDSIYDQQPSVTAPYSAGKVKDSALQAALARLNAMRRIAGLPAVSLDSSLTEQAQCGAVVVAATGSLSHTPAKSAGMDDSFYQKGYKAASSSNLAQGYGLVGSIDGWMDDSDSGNIDRLGHRRWQLNPTMGKTGFGSAGRTTVEWSFDRSGSGCDYNFISWPASGNFPSGLFDGSTAWSVTVNPSLYATPEASDLTVTLTRKSDGKVWTFRGGGAYSPSSGPYFNVNTSGYGVGNCVIFRPDGVGGYSGTYSVSISGLRYKNGGAAELSYEVDFFDAKNQQAAGQEEQSVGGENPFTDVVKGSYYYDAVLWALENNITTGVTATRFQPDAACTRGQVVTFLWRAKGCPEPKAKANPFTDVASSSPFYKAILWAQESGVTTGTTATTFSPGNTCTSAHVVTFLWRAEGRPTVSGQSGLADPGQYYADAVAWADASGLLSGVGSGFSPSRPSPRADIVTYLYRSAL